VVNYATVGRSHSGKLLSQEEKRASKEQKKREKEERKNAKRPDKVKSDVGTATSNSDADSPSQLGGHGTQLHGAEQPRKGHTRNKSWTLTIKDAGKRNKLDRGTSDKDHTFDGISPASPRSASPEACTSPPQPQPQPHPQLSMSMPSLPSPCDDLSAIRQGTHGNGNRPPIPFMTPRQPAPMFAHVALMSPGSLGSSTSGGSSSSGVRSPPSFGSLSSNSSASSSPASSPRGHPPPSPPSSGTSTGNSSTNSGAGATTATKVPSPRSRGFTYMQSLDQQMSPLAINNARAAPYSPPSPGSGSGKSASTIVPATSSEQHPVIMRAVSVTSLTSMAATSPVVPSPSSGSLSAPHGAVAESGGGASMLSPGRRPPPVPPKSAKPAVLMSQDSLPAVRAKPS
jgi:hypothetical protein